MELRFTDTAKMLGLYLPEKGTSASAGWDLSACIGAPVIIHPGQVSKIPLGVMIHIGSESHYGPLAGLLLPRSSNSGLVLDNTVGLIDADYQGEIMAKLRNIEEYPITIKPKDRIAQLVIVPVMSMLELDVVERFSSDTERGAGGFGSTGGNYTHR